MERHKQYKKQLILDKDLTGNKVLLQKYDTCRALALKLVIILPFISLNLLFHSLNLLFIYIIY